MRASACTLALTGALVVALLAWPPAAASQTVGRDAEPIAAFVGLPVVSITLTREGVPATDAVLTDMIEMRVGQPLVSPDVRDSIAHLFSLGRFEDIRVYATPAPGGVAVRVDLLPVHAVGRIAFAGHVALDEGDLRRAISDRFGASPAPARAADVAQALEALYREHGYFKARIQPRATVEHRDERTILTFDIDAGPRLTLATVTYHGNAPGTLALAEAQIGLTAGQPYDQRHVAARIASYIANLRRRGYYEAHGEHTLERVSPDGRTGELAVHVDGGARIVVTFEGDAVPQKVRADLVPVEREASVDEDLLEDGARALADYFRAQGYRDAAATYERVPGPEELTIAFRVTRGPLYRVGRVELSGNPSMPLSTLGPLLRVREGEPLVEAQLDADVRSIMGAYRRAGFPNAKVQSAVLPEPGPGPVSASVRLSVTEGARVVVGAVSIQGNAAIPEARLREGLRTVAGEPLFEPQLAVDRDGMLLKYLNLGYRNADIDVQVDVAKDGSRADVRFDVVEGQQVFVDHVLVVGNERTKTETVRREIQLRPGDPLGFDAVADTQRRLTALGLFRRVRITELDHGDPESRDLLVSVEEAPSTTVGYGGGVEVTRRLVQTSETAAPEERFEFAPRGFLELGRRNLFGRNRSVNLFTRVSLRTRSDPVITNDGEQPATDFNEYRIIGTYRQPRVFGSTDFVASGFAEQGARTSFDFSRVGTRAQLARRLGPRWSLAARYTLDRTKVFNETFSADGEDKTLIDRLFPQVRLSAFSSSVIRDTRDDALGPSTGTLLGIDAHLAGRAIGSEVGFTKGFVHGFAFRRLPGHRGIVLATGARLGLAAGFARDVAQVDENGDPVVDEDGNPVIVRVDDLPASERFFSGGDTTVRGWGLDQLGTPETIDANGFPVGGNAVLVLNVELRVPVWRDLGAVTFLDGGNVFRRIPDFDLGEIRGAVGFGLRYRSPIGPLRLDLGFKLDRRLLPNGQDERPTALFVSLGEAF